MITVEAAQSLARDLLARKKLPFGDCVEVLEFPNGVVTLHFARTDTRFFRDGVEHNIVSSPGTLVAMVDRKDSTVVLPDYP